MASHEKGFQTALKLYQCGSFNESEAIVMAQLRKTPKSPNFLRLFGDILLAQGNPQKANILYRKALRFAPNDTVILHNLANNLTRLQQYAKAKELYLRITKLEPLQWQAYFNLGMACRCLNEFSAAESFFQQALELEPSSIPAFNFLVEVRLTTGRLTAVTKMADTIESMARHCISNGQATHLPMLIRMAPLIPMQPETYRCLLRKMDQIYRRPAIQQPQNVSRTDGKIRIGYIAGEFGDHPISHVMWDVFGLHNRYAFEVVVYSLVNKNGNIDQTYTNHIRAHCDEYIDLSGCSLKQAVGRIAHDEIDILVNLSGYMTAQSVEIGSFCPAAINVYWLGHGGALGLSSVDYVIANDIVIPESEWPSHDDKVYSESVISMPESYHCAPTPIIPECKWKRKYFGLNEDGFVFCAFNNTSKINKEVFNSWMSILKRVPNSQLWLSNPYEVDELPNNLGIEAKSSGIDPERLVFASRIPEKLHHLARHQLADLFLDTFSYNASTTAIDALWAGLPVLTRLGDDFFSRICASHVTYSGLEDMVCDTTQRFEDRAVELAKNPELLVEIRKRLVDTRDIQSLFDVPRFVRHLESAYQKIWERHQSWKKPISFHVKAAE